MTVGDGRTTNPFENREGLYLALVNGEGQYSLWPDGIEVPDGWESAYPATSRDECLGFIERAWIDMRPKSVQTARR